MRKANLYVIAGALMCSTMLPGCGSNDEKMKNPMQEERSRPGLGSQPEARGTDQNTPGRQAGEGEEGVVNSEVGGREMIPSQKITENVSSAPNLTTMASAIKQAGLLNTLNATGPYTLFAPNNESFEALPEGVLEDLMKQENKQELTAILNNHIIAGKLTAQNLQDGAMLKTVGGQQLKVTKRGEETMINGAKVVLADKMSSNGVIHVINKVLMPEQK